MLHSLSSHALLPYVKPLSVVRTRGLRHGFLLFHWNSMGSPFTRMNLLMLFVCVMAGLLLIYHPTVFVAKPFLSIMHLAVHTVLFPSSAITMFVISLRNYFQKFAMMFKLNHTSSPCMTGEILRYKSAVHAVMPGLILELLASGVVVITIPFLMFVFSMFLLRVISPLV